MDGDNRTLALALVGIALALAGVALAGYGIALYPDQPMPVYTVDPTPVDEVEVGTPTELSTLDPAVREPIERAIENESRVSFEAHQVPQYVAYENRTYDLQSVHGDPGGTHFFERLGTIILGVVAVVAGAVVARAARRQ